MEICPYAAPGAGQARALRCNRDSFTSDTARTGPRPTVTRRQLYIGYSAGQARALRCSGSSFGTLTQEMVCQN